MKQRTFTVFEHQTLTLGQTSNGEGAKFDIPCLDALRRFYGNGKTNSHFYSLIHNGVRFNQHVGVIQVGRTIIEVLPKADKTTGNDLLGKNEKSEERWRKTLMGMLRAVGVFEVHAPTKSALRLRSNSILDLYFELFITEVESLLHQGLLKQYRKQEGNVQSLKGRLLFGKHLQKNLAHQEHFYVQHPTYDVSHPLHFILYKAIRLLKQINSNVTLQSRIGTLLLYFPEMLDQKITADTFTRIVYTRKNLRYKKAIEIARLLLLNYHPDLTTGQQHVLAVMFDMNRIWEKFVFISLRKKLRDSVTVRSQPSKLFWEEGRENTNVRIRPDIVLEKGGDCIVLDTKWKVFTRSEKPSPDDLRQMYVYHKYWEAKKVALLYPGEIGRESISGTFVSSPKSDENETSCSLLFVAIPAGSVKIDDFQNAIVEVFYKHFKQPTCRLRNTNA